MTNATKKIIKVLNSDKIYAILWKRVICCAENQCVVKVLQNVVKVWQALHKLLGGIDSMALFAGTSFRIMEQGLRYTVENNKVISHNIANIDTRGYKSKYLTFSGVLRDKLNTNSKYSQELHLRTNDIIVDEKTNGQPDENNVDYEIQASMLKSNALRQEAIIHQIESELRMLRSALRKS